MTFRLSSLVLIALTDRDSWRWAIPDLPATPISVLWGDGERESPAFLEEDRVRSTVILVEIWPVAAMSYNLKNRGQAEEREWEWGFLLKLIFKRERERGIQKEGRGGERETEKRGFCLVVILCYCLFVCLSVTLNPLTQVEASNFFIISSHLPHSYYFFS